MDAKEAIEEIKSIKQRTQNYYDRHKDFFNIEGTKKETENELNSLSLAISALEKVETLEAENARLKEKETPKKANDQYGYYYCPQCHNQITTEVFNDETQEHEYAPMKFCPYCGQAINNDKE